MCAMASKVGVICRHRCTPEQLVCAPNGMSFSCQGHQNNAVLLVKMSANAAMAKLENLGARIYLVRGDLCEGVNTDGLGIQIKSKLLVMGAVKTTINDQGCQHVTGRFESIRMFLSKQTGWPTFLQSHPSVKTVEWFKKHLSQHFTTNRKGKN